MLIGLKEQSIILQTRKGTNITNYQSREISQFNKNYFNKIENDYPNALKRTKPSGLYNCHGMTFASRRCFIENSEQIFLILSDDDYIEIDHKNVLPGDIVLYFSKDGDIEHSGIVIEKPEPPFYIPKIVSKWATHAEFIHYANDCPYEKTNIKYFRIVE